MDAILRRIGLGRLTDLDPRPTVVRYQREHPGELIHLNTKKLGRIVRPSHRVTRNRRDAVRAPAEIMSTSRSMMPPGSLTPR